MPRCDIGATACAASPQLQAAPARDLFPACALASGAAGAIPPSAEPRQSYGLTVLISTRLAFAPARQIRCVCAL